MDQSNQQQEQQGQQPQSGKGLIKYETTSGQITLSPEIVRRHLISGGGNVSDKEIMYFMALCKAMKINPFIKEAYLIKYGNSQEEPASIVVGKDVFVKRSSGHPDYNGCESGVLIQMQDGALVERKGSLTLPGETLVGGWCKVYRKSWGYPVHKTVSLTEYMARKKDGTPAASWKVRPATMIVKVAECQAKREAFPEELSQCYGQEEMGIDNIPAAPIVQDLVQKSGELIADLGALANDPLFTEKEKTDLKTFASAVKSDEALLAIKNQYIKILTDRATKTTEAKDEAKAVNITAQDIF